MDLKPGLFAHLAMLCLLPAAVWAATGDGSPNDANLAYVGRWDKTVPTQPHSYWGGAYVRTGFTGTAISAKLAKKADIVVFIDAKGGVVMTGVSGTVTAASGLASGNHTIKLVARFKLDELVFQGFVLDAGAKTLPAQKSAGLVEFIGNSISSGEKTTKGDVSAFPWLTGEALGADHTQISYPGITLVNGYHYTYTGAPMIGQEVQYTKLGTPPLYPSTAATTTAAWDFTRYTPDLVVINLGTNDNGTGVPSATFQTSYVNFLKLLRSKFPTAQLFGMRTFAGNKATETEAAVNQMIAAGDKKVHFINTTGWLVSTDFNSDGLHPTDAGHAKVESKLAPILRPYLDSSTTEIVRKPLAKSATSAAVVSGHLALSVRADGRNMAKAAPTGTDKVRVNE